MDLHYRVKKGEGMLGDLGYLWRKRNLCFAAKVEIFEVVVTTTVLYGFKTWMLNPKERRREDIFDIKCLKKVLGVNVIVRVRNNIITERCYSRSLLNRLNQTILKWFGHMEWMNVGRLIKGIYVAEVQGARGRRNLKERWAERVKEQVEQKGLNFQEDVRRVKNRNE